MDNVQSQIQKAVQNVFAVDVTVVLTRPDTEFGDLSTNVALQLSKQLGKPPRAVAEDLAAELRAKLADTVSEVTIAGPGFINLKLADKVLLDSLTGVTQLSQPLEGKIVVVEYSDPNPFKILHAGHLYTSIVGDAIANLQAAQGATVHRVNFGGDVGRHVAQTMYSMLKHLGGEHPEKLSAIDEEKRSEWMAACYIEGTNAYEDEPSAKEEIIALNKKVYQLHATQDHTSPLAQIYWTTRDWSYAYFDAFYARIGTKFEKYYPESEVSELGEQTVRDHLAEGIFEESDGAVVFKGEPYGLHTRVFINREGLPTYEAKDVGLLFTKKQDYNFDTSIVITGNEQEQYMQVVLKAVEQFAPELTAATRHITHGLVKMQGGVKMSSRKGNILRAVDVIDVAHAANSKVNEQADEQVTLGAIKYAFLKVRTGGDIVYDAQESVSLEGNSGPYLQYAYARARSILAKSKAQHVEQLVDFQGMERGLVVKLTEYQEVVGKAAATLMPHLICTYLYELAQEFNRFYENNRVVGDPREAERVYLVKQYAKVLKQGLELLGIDAPEQM